MDHDKIEAVLKRLDYSQRYDTEMFNVTRVSVLDAVDLIRDLRGEIDNQETRIVDLEEASNAVALSALIVDSISTQISEGDGSWRPCSGCHELNEGHDTGPYSDVFKCALGGGCRECGGIGAIWDATDYGDLADSMIEDDTTSADNAALIAAVPALVEALEHARARFQCVAEEADGRGDDAGWAMASVDADRMAAALASIGRKP